MANVSVSNAILPTTGNGGGGNGGNQSTAGVAGSTNTGGGGGAGSNYPTSGNPAGGNGGSGIVIIRYANTYSEASASTGSPTVTVAGGYRVYKWITSGSITF